MAKRIDTSFNNFAQGQLDHDMMGRYDLPVYTSGGDIVTNWITNFKGNVIFRAGFEQIVQFQNCVFVEFKFNLTQQYLCCFFANTIQFISYDTSGNCGWVLNGGGTTLQVTTPYSLSDLSDIQFTQNFDQLIMTQWNYEPRALKRTSANSFTFLPYSRKADPFVLTNTGATKTISGITQDSTGATFTFSAAHGLTVGQRFTVTGVVGMTQMNTYTVAVISVVDANNIKSDIDTSLFTAYTSGGVANPVATGDYPHACLFYKGALWYGATKLHSTRIFASVKGNYFDHTLSPITDTSAMQLDIVEIAQRIEWMFAGDNSMIVGATDGILAVNGGAINTAITPNTIDAQLTSALPCNGVYPFKKDGLVFYLGTPSRNMYYFNYDILQSIFVSSDANTTAYDITKSGLQKMRWKKDKNDLIFFKSGDGRIVACNFLAKEKIIGWEDFTTTGTFQDIGVITDNTSTPQLFALVLHPDGNYYIERQSAYVEFAKLTDFFSGQDQQENDLNAYIRYTSEQLKSCNYLDNAIQLNDLQVGNTITYTGTGVSGAIAASTAVFASGDVGKHIVYQTETGYESGRFLITSFTDNKHVGVTVLQPPTTNSYDNWYRTFSTVSGLSDYIGQTISVVADGGYLSDFVVPAGGNISLENQFTNIWVGYRYKGILKTFILGFPAGTVNTQETLKELNQFYVRCASSAGLQVGSDMYHLEDVQLRQSSDLNYLPPQLIDGTQQVPFVDESSDRDRCIYAIQDFPLPATITSILVSTAYTIST